MAPQVPKVTMNDLINVIDDYAQALITQAALSVMTILINSSGKAA